MSNITKNISINFHSESKNMFAVYIVGIFFTFVILCQSIFKNTNTRPTLRDVLTTEEGGRRE